MKIRMIIKRLKNPRVRRRLKIGLSVFGGAILIAVTFKIVYDIGYFEAQSLEDEKNTRQPTAYAVLTMASAQRIVTGALKEDPSNPSTVVEQVIYNNPKLSTIVIANKQQKKIAWIIDMRLFFMGDLYNEEGYNLTEALAQQNNISQASQ
ncbi:MAG: hypothetical protein HOP34_03490 [Methylococcaceae bacterium]|nr:hypothetical protein [Methylococcaceae bacterium]